jgi:hypothetical protein
VWPSPIKYQYLPTSPTHHASAVQMIKFVGNIALASFLWSFGSAQSITQPSQLPAWTDLRACVTNAVAGVGIESGILFYLGCQNYACGCSDGGSGATLSEVASIYCSDSAAGDTATSVWSTFCSELLGGSPITTSVSSTTSSILLITTSFSPTTSFVGELSQPSQMPGWTNLRACVTNAVAGDGIENGILYYVGCQDYACACSDAGSGSTLSQVASIYCYDSAAGATATSVWDSFCSQLLLGNGAVDGSPTSRRVLT